MKDFAMDDILVYERLSFNLLDYTICLRGIKETVNQLSGNKDNSMLLNGYLNPFDNLCCKVSDFISKCFLRNCVNELRLKAIYSSLSILDKFNADEFKDSVLSCFNMRDFIVPEARGKYLELFTEFSRYLNAFKARAGSDEGDKIDALLKGSDRDLRRYSTMDHSSDCVSSALNFTNNYYDFLNSLCNKQYAGLIWLLDEYDGLFIKDSLLRSRFGVPSKSFDDLKSVINVYSANVNSLGKRFDMLLDFLDNLGIMYLSFVESSDLHPILDDDVKKLYL